MIIRLDRRTEGSGGREAKFEVSVRPLDQYHTHGELTRCDQELVRAVLARAADDIAEILRQVPPRTVS